MASKVTIKKPTSAPADYKSTAKAPAAYTLSTYKSPYEKALTNALNTVTNWKYDPLQDASYQALAKVYGARGNIAAKNTLADAAALNGGYQTSYAVSAAQQARNQYNQELAALIPDLENMAYTRATGTLSALREADNTKYGRFRDTESDKQWKYTQDYQKYRDKEADAQWAWTQQYNKYRDLMSDYQWGTNYNFDVDKFNYQQKRDSVADSQWQQTFNYNKSRDAVSDSQWQQNFSYQQQRDAIADSQWAQEFALKKSDAIGGGGSGGGGGGRSGGGGGYSSGGGGGGDYSGVSGQIESAKKKTKKSSSDAIVKGAMATQNIAKAALRKRKGNGGR